MNIILLGAAGFIGANLVKALAGDETNNITVVDRNRANIEAVRRMNYHNVRFIETELTTDTDFAGILKDGEAVYHLISTTVPSTSNRHIGAELQENIIVSSNLFDACVKVGVKKVIFISSGGTVYGREAACPLREDAQTNPITAYGIQKVTIEKLLYLYNYMYGIDYRIIRLSNPFGPYQRTDGVQGAVSTFIYRALKGEDVTVYGDGSAVRDYIYIDDAVRGIINIAKGAGEYSIYNLGSGCGTAIKELISVIENTLNLKMKVVYKEARKVDVPVNYLDISRYESCYGPLEPVSLAEGIGRTAEFMRREML